MKQDYNHLKLFSAQQTDTALFNQASPANPSGATTVAEATAGMTWEQKYHWMHEQLDKTIAEMEKAGIHVDKSKIRDISYIDDKADFAYYDYKSQLIRVFNLSDKITVQELRMMLAHEVDHSQHPAPRNKHEDKLLEQAGDNAIARTYGAQPAIDFLENMGKIAGDNPRHREHGDPHGSIRDRQHLIAHHFPEEHAVVPKEMKIIPKNTAPNKALKQNLFTV